VSETTGTRRVRVAGAGALVGAVACELAGPGTEAPERATAPAGALARAGRWTFGSAKRGNSTAGTRSAGSGSTRTGTGIRSAATTGPTYTVARLERPIAASQKRIVRPRRPIRLGSSVTDRAANALVACNFPLPPSAGGRCRPVEGLPTSGQTSF
jgi:hypothetical protein